MVGQYTRNPTERTCKEWHTVALAGTMPMQNEVMPTDWDKKNQEEQGYVADYIRRIVKKFGNKMNEKGPYTARAGQLVHLKTDFDFPVFPAGWTPKGTQIYMSTYAA